MRVQELSQLIYEFRKHLNIPYLQRKGIIQPRNTHSRIHTRNLQRTRTNKNSALWRVSCKCTLSVRRKSQQSLYIHQGLNNLLWCRREKFFLYLLFNNIYPKIACLHITKDNSPGQVISKIYKKKRG
jgi:hypothetical protein